jgi:hypothetical protein
MATQINLDLVSKITPPDEKKEFTLSFRAGEKFKNELQEMAAVKGLSSLSDLIAEYVIEQYSQDYRKLLHLKQKVHKTVGELMAQS